MGIEVISGLVAGGLVIAAIAFVFSFSIILNIITIIGIIVASLFSRSLLKENGTLTQEMSELDSQLIISDSVNDIVEHVLLLRDQLYELTQMDLYTGEPTIQALLETVTITLEKIESSVIKQEYMRSLEDK